MPEAPRRAASSPAELPPPIRATAHDLPPDVEEALRSPADPRIAVTMAAGIPFASRSWGDPANRPLLLVHGVTSDSETWWRLGPALAATGRRVVAPDLPGHGLTGHWAGRHRFAETAADLAAFARAAGLGRPDLQVVGHSWGSMVVAGLPAAGLRPRTLVLLDPPSWPRAAFIDYAEEPLEQPFETLDDALAAVRAEAAGWPEGDIAAKAAGLTRFEVAAARAVVLGNGDWDAGLASLAHPAAGGLSVWIVKGEERTGSMTLDAALPALAARVGPDHVLTIADGEHSPQRLHPEATLVALLRALDGRSRR